MGRRNVTTANRWRSGVAIALLAASACSGSDEGDGDAAVDDTAADEESASSVATDGTTANSSPGDEVGSSDPPATEQPTGPLGFATDVFDIPIPADADPEFAAFENSNELIDAGIDAGVWTEVEGVRAIVSVVMGELPPAAIPAIAELPRLHYREVIDRAIGLLDAPAVDRDQAADLARLVWFFTSDSLTFTEVDVADDDGVDTGQSDEGASGAGTITPVGLRPAPEQQEPCYQGEVTLFKAEATPYCYVRFEQGDDVVHISRAPDAFDISVLIFEIIRKARPGYLALAGEELQPVHVLVSTNPSPETADDDRGDSDAHVASAVDGVCRVAIFASSTLTANSFQLDFTIAHELFHCIQGLWSADRPGDFVTEAGADYFAYELLDKLCTGPQVALGNKLDADTATGSLLDSSYEGWFFWAYLAEHKNIGPPLIATAHQAIHNGAPIEETVLGQLGDPPAAMNEFFVRLVGPGLACDFKGSKFTNEIDVKEKGPVELVVANVWSGTRYKLKYAEKKLFEQSGDDRGPVGMAEFEKRGAEDEWVVTEPEVRTTCEEIESWMVVVSPNELGSSTTTMRKLEVDEVKPGGCDPCLIGSWSVDMDSYQERLNARSPVKVEISGSYTLSFEPGPPVGGLEFSDRQQTLMEFPSIELGFGVDVDASGGGTYTAIDGNLVSEGYLVSGEGSGVGVPIDTSSPFSASGDGGAPYICDGDDLTIVFDDASLDAVRMPETPEGEAYFR